MKKSTKFALTIGALTMAAFITTGCTSNFCTNIEKSRMLFATDPGVSTYYASEEEAINAKKEGYNYFIEKVFDDNDHLYRSVEVIDKEAEGANYLTYTKSNQLTSILSSAVSKGIAVPSYKYFAIFDTKVLTKAAIASNLDTSSITVEQVNTALTDYGYIKFYSDAEEAQDKHNAPLWGYYSIINGQIAYEYGDEIVPNKDFVNLYQTNMNQTINSSKACIATVEGDYGNYGQEGTRVRMDAKGWGYAWRKGPISGLIVWPVAALTDVMATSFAGGVGTEAMLAGWPQLLALIIATVIVRLFILGATFKSVLDQQKMQALQPELAKIQAKYPNSNTSQSEKQRVAEEQMKLYKKHKVNPLSQILMMFIQFPIFIGVWGAFSGSAVLSTGTFLHLNLSTSIWTALKNVKTLPTNAGGWWTALVLFLLMAAGQFLAMKLPQWIAKKRTAKISRMGVNPAQNQQNKTMNIVSYAMLAMIVVMGFTLPAAMGVYWFVGAIFSLAQSLITQLVLSKNKYKK